MTKKRYLESLCVKPGKKIDVSEMDPEFWGHETSGPSNMGSKSTKAFSLERIKKNKWKYKWCKFEVLKETFLNNSLEKSIISTEESDLEDKEYFLMDFGEEIWRDDEVAGYLKNKSYKTFEEMVDKGYL